jgi:hypothetical protein
MIQVEVIKRSSDNSIEGTSTFNETPKPSEPKNKPNSQVAPSKKEDDRTETELKNLPGENRSYGLG